MYKDNNMILNQCEARISEGCNAPIEHKAEQMALFEVVAHAEAMSKIAAEYINQISDALFGDCVKNIEETKNNPDGFYGFCHEHAANMKNILKELEYIKRRLGVQ